MTTDKISYEQAFAKCLIHVEQVIKEMPNPPAEYSACGDGHYFRYPPFLPFEHVGTWMTSFYIGEGLLCGHKTGDGRYLEWARGFLPAYRSKIMDTPMDTMHDIGFLYTLYGTAIYQESKDEEYRKLSLKAADELVKRLHPEYGLIRAWGRRDNMEHHSAGLAIIDCMMNLPLLFFAWQETRDSIYRQAACRHADNTLAFFIRADGSVCHGYQYMAADGQPQGEVNHCGYGVGSFWARGLAWAFYGFALAYRYTGIKRYLDTAIRLGERYWEEIARDGTDVVPPWDFRLPAEASAGMVSPGEKKRDSSAAAIMACGFDELSRLTGRDSYRQEGMKLLNRLMEEDYQNPDLTSCGILTRSNGRDHCTSFGDYFYIEALLRYGDGFRGYF